MPMTGERLRSWLEGFSGRTNDPSGGGPAGEARPKRRKSAVPWLVLALGVCGILLLGAGDCRQTASSASASSGTDSLARDLERLVSAISGDPEPVVALTYSQGEEYRYEFDERQTASGSEREVALYEDASGRSRGLVRTSYSPQVAGVAVVCRDGSDASVRLRVTEAVAAALRLSSDRIYVTAKGAG